MVHRGGPPLILSPFLPQCRKWAQTVVPQEMVGGGAATDTGDCCVYPQPVAACVIAHLPVAAGDRGSIPQHYFLDSHLLPSQALASFPLTLLKPFHVS